MHNFLSLFFRGGVVENSVQFFVLIFRGGARIQFYEIFFRGGSCNSCMKLLEKMHTFLSLFAVAENSAQFFNLVDGGWSSNSCMKLLEKKCTLFCRYLLWWGG